MLRFQILRKISGIKTFNGYLNAINLLIIWYVSTLKVLVIQTVRVVERIAICAILPKSALCLACTRSVAYICRNIVFGYFGRANDCFYLIIERLLEIAACTLVLRFCSQNHY